MPVSDKPVPAKDLPIRLSFQSKEQVIVTADDGDRFYTTSQAAARACKAADSNQAWIDEFREMLKFVHDECARMAPLVNACYVSVCDEGLRVFLTVAGQNYNRDLVDKITEMDIEIAKRFPNCPTDCVQIPSEPAQSLSSFFSLNDALQVYGDRNRAPNKSE